MSLSSNSNFTLRRNIWIVQSDAAVGQFYTFAAKSTPWPNDTIPPNLDNSVALNEYQIIDEMLFGKFVGNAGLSLMTNRYDWTSGTVYDHYDDTDVLLFQKQFFVLTSEGGNYHVFKCLNNNNNSPSTYQPKLAETSATDQFYSTADGYQWKYMYSFSPSTYATFATSQYIPVVANTAVVGNAVPGALETFIITSPGGNYNSVTNGYFTDIAVGGNTQYFGIQGDDTTILKISSNTFTVGETVTQAYAGTLANGVIVAQSTSGANSTLTLKSVNGIFATSNTITGLTSGKIAAVTDASSPSVSSNSNFYNGCSIYIGSGTGAGQINTILQYLVIGNARRVLLAQPFATTPDLTSKYAISPRVSITGDGSNAQAISIVDPNTKQLKDIRVINKGSGYTYANVAIFGNTGSTAVASNNATVRAVISPRGGHGSDPYAELDSTYLAYSTTFANTENGKIPGTGATYRRVGIITNPLYANVTLTYSYTTSPGFPVTSNVTVTGSVSNATGIITGVNAGANTVKLTNVTGLFQSGDVLTATYANGAPAVSSSANAQVTSITGQGTVFDNRTKLICPSSTLTGGTFAVNEKIVQVDGGIDLAYGVIQEIDVSGSNTYIYLTETKGTFQSSDTVTGSYKYIYDDATRQKRIEVDTIVASDLVPYTGNILYVENIVPVTRNSLQSETVKLTIGFS